MYLITLRMLVRKAESMWKSMDIAVHKFLLPSLRNEATHIVLGDPDLTAESMGR